MLTADISGTEGGMMTAAEIVALMRLHRITIRDLAARMNITLARVRYVRERGITGTAYVADWLQGITGRAPQ